MNSMKISVLVLLTTTALIMAGCGGGSSSTTGTDTTTVAGLVKQQPASTSATTGRARPGHYLIFNEQESNTVLQQRLNGTALTGALKHYRWRELESFPGHYDFSRIRADLAELSLMHKQLVVEIDLESGSADAAFPEYIQSRYVVELSGGKKQLRIWDAYVTDRLTVLFAELSAHLDQEPAFEGVMITIPAVELDDASRTKYAYSPELYRDAIAQLVLSGKNAFPGAGFFWSIPSQSKSSALLINLAATLNDTRIGIGGFNLLPDDEQWSKSAVPFYKNQHGKTSLFTVVSSAGYAHERRAADKSRKYWSMTELMNTSRQHKIDYIFWSYLETRAVADSSQWSDVVSALNNTAVP